MNISKLRLGNFKGFSELIEFNLRPLTFFYGANSSGKSSVIHALTALSQTLKLTNNKRPLILDDERAFINLGRFIEVIHSKKYTDFVQLGFDLPNQTVLRMGPDNDVHYETHTLTVDLCFGCTKKTQEIYLAKACFKFGQMEIRVTKNDNSVSFELNPGALKGTTEFQKGFLLEESSFLSAVFSLIKDQAQTQSVMHQFFSLNKGIKDRLENTIYLGPFRQPPSRKYDTYGSLPTEVGSRGESCATLLANEAVQSAKQPHFTQIGNWLGLLGLGKKVRLERIGKSDSFGLDITLLDEKSLPISDLGFGLSQVLPVLAQCSFAPKSSTLLFEQPELHLHPKAQGPLTEIFASTISEKNCQIIAETHSPELIRSALRLLRAGKLQLSDIAIYKIERKNCKSHATRVEIYKTDDDFDVAIDWEKDFSS
jgi:hypothetical protein